MSVSDRWSDAKLEWGLHEVYFKPGGVCLCRHAPITEHCVIQNSLKGSLAVVGNVCVTRFLGIPASSIFQGLNRIAADPTQAMNEAALEYIRSRGWLTDWEYEFYQSTRRKRTLSWKQREKRVEINQFVTAFVNRPPKRDP